MKNTSLATYFYIFGIITLSITDIDCLNQEQESRSIKTTEAENRTSAIKDWTIAIHIAGRNDLSPFAVMNLNQMQTIGSSDHLNLCVQYSIPGKNKPTQRFLVEQNRLIEYDQPARPINSGAPESVIDFVASTIKKFPANKYGIIFWDHGTGPLCPHLSRSTKNKNLFTFNDENSPRKTENITFPNFLNIQESETPDKAICFDDTFKSYLNNQDLELALREICQGVLGGKKLDFVAFDACLMMGIEISNIVRPYAHFIVGSQNIELGTGYDYRLVFSPFKYSKLDGKTVAQHIVGSFELFYKSITNDYTQSAVDLEKSEALEENVHHIAGLLFEALGLQKGTAVRDAIRASRSSRVCTVFDEPSFIDLNHFFSNLLRNLHLFQFSNQQRGEQLRRDLEQSLKIGMALVDECVIANCCGKNLQNAHGISIYFPEQRMHSSYKSTKFAMANNWGAFLMRFLS